MATTFTARRFSTTAIHRLNPNVLRVYCVLRNPLDDCEGLGSCGDGITQAVRHISATGMGHPLSCTDYGYGTGPVMRALRSWLLEA